MEEQHKDYQEKSVEVIKRIQDQPSKLLEKEGLFSFYNLNYTIIKKKKEEKILRNINGYCQRGKLLAIMGSSGRFFQKKNKKKSKIEPKLNFFS